MNIRPIKTKKDHDAALRRIESLMGARKNTAKGGDLDVLATLVAAYEEKYFSGC